MSSVPNPINISTPDSEQFGGPLHPFLRRFSSGSTPLSLTAMTMVHPICCVVYCDCDITALFVFPRQQQSLQCHVVMTLCVIQTIPSMHSWTAQCKSLLVIVYEVFTTVTIIGMKCFWQQEHDSAMM